MLTTVALIAALPLLALLVASIVLSRVSLELDPETNKYKLRSSTFSGRYYLFICNFLNGSSYWDETNSCTIAKRVFWGTILLVIVAALILFVVTCLIVAPIELFKDGFDMLNKKSPDLFDVLALLGLVFWGVLFLGGFFIIGDALLQELHTRTLEKQARRQENVSLKQVSSLRLWWRGVKGKFCLPVQFVRDR